MCEAKYRILKRKEKIKDGDEVALDPDTADERWVTSEYVGACVGAQALAQNTAAKLKKIQKSLLKSN